MAKTTKPVVKKAVAKTTPKPVAKATAKPTAKPTVKEKTKTVAKSIEKKAVVQKVKQEAKKPVVTEKAAPKKVETKVSVKETVSAKPVAKKLPVVETKPKTNAPKIKGYSTRDLEHFKKIILVKRAEIIEQLQNLREQMIDTQTGEYINENSPYSLHMADQGSDAMEREKVYLWAQRETKFLTYLDEALKRIELGTYGLCIECIDDPKHLCPTCPLIPKERLEAVPHTQHCVQVKQQHKDNK